MFEKEVRNQKTGEEYLAHIRLLKATEVGKFEHLHMKLVQEINDKHILNASSSAFSAACISQKSGFCLGSFIGEELIGYFMIYIPHDDPTNLGLDINLPKEKRSQVAHFDQVGIEPSYRKNGLIFLMRKIALKRLLEREINYVFSTISPKNIPSIRSATNNGAIIVKLSEKSGGRMRYTIQHLSKIQLTFEEAKVFHTDYAQQQALLKQGCVGVKISKDGYISYYSTKNVEAT